MRRRRSGYIFIQALIIVAGLVALMAMMAADQRARVQVIENTLAERRAQAAADAGLARAMAVLQQANPDVVTLNDDWAQQGHSGDDEFAFNDKSATYRMQIGDAASLLNLNTASQTQLQALPLDQDQVDTLLDWIQKGETARADGAKDAYYNGLQQPYNAKLGNLTTVDELLLIDNWTAQTLYQPPVDQTPNNWGTDQNGAALPLAAYITVDSGSPNVQASGSAKLNLDVRSPSLTRLMQIGISRNIATQIQQDAPYASFRALLATPGLSATAKANLLNGVTFTTNTRTTGLINLNTASQAVLSTLNGMNPATAQAIASQQGGGFSTLGALSTTTGITPAQLNLIADYVTVASDTFIVRSYGESGGFGIAEETVVQVSNNQVQVINKQRLNVMGVPSWWNWKAHASSNYDAGDSQ